MLNFCGMCTIINRNKIIYVVNDFDTNPLFGF